MDWQPDQYLHILMLHELELDAIASRVKPLSEMVKLRSVCSAFHESVRRVLLTIDTLDGKKLPQEALEFLLPEMRGLKVIRKDAIDTTPWGTAVQIDDFLTLLANRCPKLEYFHDASAIAMRDYALKLEALGKPVKIKLVRVIGDDLTSAELLDLIRAYNHINIFADDMVPEFFTLSLNQRQRSELGPRLLKIITDNSEVPELETIESMLEPLTRLLILDITIHARQVSLIPLHCPWVKHLRITDLNVLESSSVTLLIEFIEDHISRYESFGMIITEAEKFDDTWKIVRQLVESRARIRGFPQARKLMDGSRLVLGVWWSVDVDAVKRMLTINSWPATSVTWLYRLFPTELGRPVRLNALSPRASGRVSTPNDITSFLEPLAEIRALTIKLSADNVNLIPQICLRLRHLRLHIFEREKRANLDQLRIFLISRVAGYESFSLSIDQPLDSETAFKIVRCLAKLGAKFKYSEEFGYPFLRLGDNWHVTSCKYLCIKRWPIERADLFVCLFRPSKTIHIELNRHSGPQVANRWRNAINAALEEYNLRPITILTH